MFMNAHKGRYPRLPRGGHDRDLRSTLSREVFILALVVTAFVGMSVLLVTRSVLLWAVLSSIVFLVSFIVFHLLRLIVDEPSGGLSKTDP
jgi:hypothetical protein